MAYTIKLYIDQDTWVNQRSSNTNYSTSDKLNICGSSGYYRRAFLKCVIPKDISTDDIISAKLYMFYESNDISSREQRHHIKRITSEWDQSLITYNNQPGFNGSGSLSSGSYGRLENVSGHNTGVMKWRSADITALFLEWVNGTYSNYGIVIDHNYNGTYDGGVWASIIYRSSRYSDVEFRPYIELELVDKPFRNSGELVTPLIDLNINPTIIFADVDTDSDTNIIVQKSLNKNVWLPIDIDDAIEPGDWYFKFILQTLVNTKSPVIKSITFRDAYTNDQRILLTMKPLEKFNNAAGPITVVYSGGYLMGEGGPVEPFEETFTPTDLIMKPNQMVRERLELSSLDINSQLTPIIYTDVSSGREQLELSSLSITADLIPIDDI